MSLNEVFILAHVPAAIGWAALLLPFAVLSLRRRIALVAGVALAVAYVAFFFVDSKATVLARDYSLSGVGAFFDVPRLQLAGWIHYLVIDLWAGIWEADEADRVGMARWQLTASLLLTAAFAPAGLLLFLLFHRLALSAVSTRASSPAS